MAAIIRRTYNVTLPNGKVVTRKVDHYTIQYRDAAGKIRRVKGYTDRAATVQLAARLERAQARGEEGLIDPYKAHKQSALSEHISAYIADLRTEGRDNKYIENMQHRLDRLASECGWKALPDIEPNSFIKWREREARRKDKRKHACNSGHGASATTLNQYLDSVRAFLNWCKRTNRIGSNPLADVGKVDGVKVRKRRALTDDEVTRLLDKAPAERKLVYRLGMATGLRRDELAQLLWGDVRLNAIKPYLQLRAEATKARRGDRLSLPASLADDLRHHRPADFSDADHVFTRIPTLAIWQSDLKAAGIPYRDAMGRQVDFHAGTRKTLCTRLHRAGVPLAVAMRAMRHTDARLTLVDYTDDETVGTDEALASLPELLPVATTAKAGAGAG